MAISNNDMETGTSPKQTTGIRVKLSTFQKFKRALADFQLTARYGIRDVGKHAVFYWAFFILTPVNMASLGFLWDWFGIAAILCVVVAFSTKLPDIYKYHGLTTGMGIHQLLGLIPGMVFAVLRLTTPLFNTAPATMESQPEIFVYTCLYIVTNGISILFDFRDAGNWIHGNHRVVILSNKTKERLGLLDEFKGVVPADIVVKALAKEHEKMELEG